MNYNTQYLTMHAHTMIVTTYGKYSSLLIKGAGVLYRCMIVYMMYACASLVGMY